MGFSRTVAAAASASLPQNPKNHHAFRVAIVGGSLGGLATANALQSTGRFQIIHVYERAPGPLDQKGSGLGYVNVAAWEALRNDEVPMMRRGRRAHRHQGSFYYGDLWKYLYQGLPPGTVRFGQTIEKLTMNNNNDSDNGRGSTVSIDKEEYDLVVVSDGGFSKLRKYVLRDDALDDNSNNNCKSPHNNDDYYQVEPEYAGYVVWRGAVSISKIPLHILPRIHEGVYKNGIYDTILLRQAKDNGEDLWTMGTFIKTPEDEVDQYWNKATDGTSRHGSINDNKKNVMPDWLIQHFTDHFSNTPGLVELMECIRQHGEVSPHPQYEFGRIEKVHEGRVVILGDAAHMASPRTAVGAHTAILDALALKDSFEKEPPESNIDAVLELYSHAGLRHARELYARSREVSSEFIGD
ncbi:unnamed protein product [Cylindrotheca closterium]|uniref:FAD-binding domain-containing protein n=1 Tax=Cylindrotheca closterium TaxID=2856 RepID=A0AAD2GAG3_9STRA|nr:unnamed protein product [Cylindrotheca closterium]